MLAHIGLFVHKIWVDLIDFDDISLFSSDIVIYFVHKHTTIYTRVELFVVISFFHEKPHHYTSTTYHVIFLGVRSDNNIWVKFEYRLFDILYWERINQLYLKPTKCYPFRIVKQ